MFFMCVQIPIYIYYMYLGVNAGVSKGLGVSLRVL